MFNPEDGLSTGSTLLNLATTENPYAGYLKGKYFFFVGDSNSGKTFLTMTGLAEATLNPEFAEYRFIYDNIEDGMLMNVRELFNEQMEERMEPPAGTVAAPMFSHTVESFYYNLDDALYRAGYDSKRRVKFDHPDGNHPFIYILDSQDALDSEAADKKFHEHKTAYLKKQGRGEDKDGEEEKKLAGSYGDGKAKKHSEFLRKAGKGLRLTGSILIIISQTRDDPTGGGKTRSGGRALRFWATVEWWSSIAGQIKKTVNDIERKIGTKVRVETKKNRITGKLATVEIDIYPSFGIDDIGSCVDYLCTEGVWKRGKSAIEAPQLKLTATREKLIRTIEQRGWEDQLRELCGETWAAVQAACALKRKNRYAQT